MKRRWFSHVVIRAAVLSVVVLAPLVLVPLISLASTARSTANTKSLVVLIVSNRDSKAQRLKEEQMITLIHQSLDEQGLPREVLPILTYHTNKRVEKAYCEKTLGIHEKDLVFLGLAQHKNLVVKKVVLRETNVKDATQAVGDLFGRAVAVLSGASPKSAPTSPRPEESPTSDDAPPPKEPDDTPPQPSSKPQPAIARVSSAVICRGVNGRGEPSARTSNFSARDTFFVSFELTGLRHGTSIEAKWYGARGLIRSGHMVSDKTGSWPGWFSLAPSTRWAPGTYRVTLYVDGQQQTTQYFRVIDTY